MGEVVYLPVEPKTPEQRQHWQDMAAYWAVKAEDAERALEFAQRQREGCLRLLGMLGTEAGLEG